MVAYLYSSPTGVPGDVTRPLNANVEPAMLGTPNALAFGIPVKLATQSGLSKAIPYAGGEIATDFYGILTRSVPSQSGNALSGLSNTIPNATLPQGIMTRGYVNVLCTVGTPVRGGTPFIRVVANSPKAIGDIEATADVTVVGGVITGTGTGTIAATAAANAIPGTWSLVLQTTSQTSKVTVIDPNGVRHPDATVGTAYTSGGLTFTITAAGTMTANDSFSPVVTANNIVMTAATWATDGKDANNNAEIRIGR